MSSAKARTGIRRSVEALARQETLGDRIYDDLVLQLKTGAIDRNHRFVDTELARSYGTSRMPVRDALLRLANEGYLVGTSRGFVLPKLSADDVRDIFEVRRHLEPPAAASAARLLDKSGERRLTAALRASREATAANDPTGLILANIDFRRAWLDAVANRRLVATIDRFADQVHAVRLNTLKVPATRRVVMQGLVELHDAFMQRDAARAAHLMERFIDAAHQAFFDSHVGSNEAAPVARLVHAKGRK